MNQRNNRDQKAALALALAAGRTVTAWAKEHDVPRRTAYSWARSPDVQEQVRRLRRRAIDRVVGRLSRHAAAAADRIAKLAQGAASESVQLHAARAVLADLMTVSGYAAIEERLTELERRLADRQAAEPGRTSLAG